MSNYFAKMPAAGVDLLLDREDRAAVRSLAKVAGSGSENAENVSTTAFLDPFKPKADTNYVATVASQTQRKSRTHETLVNNCADWLTSHGLEPARNAAIDLGLLDGSVIIEAKIVKGWADATRQAVGQLYEYRYFRVAEPAAGLIFLSDQPVPKEWTDYLERDRGIGVMWPEKREYRLSPLAKKLLGL